MAGSFTNTLTKPDDTSYSLQGSGTLADGVTSWMPIATSDGLYLTTNQGSLGASLVIPDLDSQGVIQGFTANFQMLLNGAADGTAFAFGPDITDGMAPFGETGPGMSQGGLAVSFDIYNNGAPDFIGISVMLNGVEYGTFPMALTSTDWKDVMIRLNRNGTLDLTYGGQTVYAGLFLPGYTDVYGQFAFGARTGGSSAIQGVRNLGITTTRKGADVTASITKQPANVSVDEPGAATFAVDFDGTPPFTFQWARNGTAIADATGNTLTLTNTTAADNGAAYKCTVANALGTVTSTAATLTVKSDTTPPTVVSAKASVDFTHVTLVFSEPVTVASAETTGNYKFDNGLTVSAAALDTNIFKTVVLTTSAQQPALTYTITINGVKDQSYGANPIAADTKVTFVSESLKVVGVGAIQKNGNTTYDVGISFNMPYDHASAATLANYTLSGGTAPTITTLDKGNGVVITVSGLTAGTDYTLKVANVKDKGGNVMAPVSNTFQVSKMKWGVVGGDRENLGNGVVTVGDNGFDIYSDGATEWNNYDESTFVYEQVTGDFDKKLRVEYQDSSSQWARAGLIARDVTNFGVTDAEQAGSQTIDGNSGVAPFDGKACRYQKVHVNPVVTVMDTAGNNSWETNRRLETGGPSSNTGGGGGVPQYPNAWCRLQRVGDLFTVYRSDDGVTWTQMGTTTFPSPMPATLFVGPDYSPENGNITDETLRGEWVARFRDYGDTQKTGPQPAELGTTVNGFQDDFTGATRDPNWVAVGPSGDQYKQQDGVLKVFASAGDPNHILYMGPGASNTVNEVLARVRVVNFSSGDPARGGVAVNVSTNVPSHLADWTGMNLNIRNTSEGTPASTVHFKLLDDLRGWGPQTTFAWTNNVWYWMRLKQQAKMDGTNSVFAKVWAADGTTAEPADWQVKWADSALPTPQHGGWAGITGCSGGGVGQLEVDYVLIKSAGLPSIKVNFAPTAPAATVPFFTGVVATTNSTSVSVNWFGGGKLQTAPAVTGAWLDVTNTLPPLVVPLTGAKAAGPQNFYRLKQ